MMMGQLKHCMQMHLYGTLIPNPVEYCSAELSTASNAKQSPTASFRASHTSMLAACYACLPAAYMKVGHV